MAGTEMPMPRPLSEVSPDGQLFFSPSVLRRSPFSSDIAYVIALWAHTDGDIASILSRMLKADIATGTAMYLSLTSAGQRTALKAAAAAALPEWQHILLRAIGTTTEPSRDDRNRFAHHVWGYCPNVPDSILLTPPEVIVEHNVSYRQRAVELPDGRGIIRPMPIDDTRIMVYDASAIMEAVSGAERAHNLFRLFYGVVAGPESNGPRKQILTDSAVAKKASELARSASDDTRSILA